MASLAAILVPIVVLALSQSRSSSPVGAIPSSSIGSPSVGLSSSPNAVACRNTAVSRDRSVDPRVLASASDQVVVVTVLSVGDAYFESSPPPAADPSVSSWRPAIAHVSRVTVVQSAKGGASAGDVLSVRVPGGAVGCSSVRYDGMAGLDSTGAEYVLFLSQGSTPSVMDAWAVVDGQVLTPAGDHVPLGTFLSGLN
jgi:hypothetical protein